jgi:type VI secretion system protein ImpK
MSERPKEGADPDATVMLPADGRGAARAPDDEATVMIPAQREDDATVMMPAPRADEDATVMMPAAGPDDDATVMIPAARDDDATVMMPAGDPDGTVVMPPRAVPEPDPEATVAIPTPGRRRNPAPALPPSPPAGSQPPALDPAALGGLNPLVAAANPVLAVVAQIRHALRHPDPRGLQASLAASVEAFERSAGAAGAVDETVRAASIALCALVDESAASTPWGSGWKEDGLLARRHGESGGDRVFDAIEARIGDPAAHRELLEFFYVCLALGFEGRYRDLPDGRSALAALRGRLLEQLRGLRGPHDGELSPHWRGIDAPARRPAGAAGLWAAAAGAALLLAAAYAGYSVSLGARSDPVARELAQLRVAAEPARTVAAAAAASPGIAAKLAAEVARGEVAVADAPGRSSIVILSDRLFASGSARLEAAVEPIVLRVAEALSSVPGTVVVTGHTDDVPIRTARFPSNWELSTERATSVVKLMAGRIGDPTRLRAEGLADSAPVAPNDTPANRARNRRVEITLRTAP